MSANTSISKLVELAKTVRMDEEQKEEQRRSFVFGNVAIEDKDVTREQVNQQAEVMASRR